MRKYWIFILFLLIIAYGCKQRVITQPGEKPSEQKPSVTQPKETKEMIPGEKAEIIQSKVITPEGKEILLEDVLFDFDMYNLKDKYKPMVKTVSSWMIRNSESRLLIEGHCDERGTNEYNLALGDRRAKTVKDYLISLGVASPRINIVSYGEERPLCTEQNEGCWSKNRRAHFIVE